MIPDTLTHQTQPTADTCQSATIAMLLDVPVQNVVDAFHDKYLSYDDDPHTYLERAGVNVTNHYAHDRIVEWDRVYMLGVPSLNLEASTHSILLDTRHEKDGACTLLDPNKGKEGKKYYTHDESEAKREELAVMLRSFVICHSFGAVSNDK